MPEDWRARSWAPFDVVQVGHDFYVVIGVYLGSVGQVSLVGLRPLTESLGNGDDEMLVPEKLLDAATGGQPVRHYRKVD